MSYLHQNFPQIIVTEQGCDLDLWIASTVPSPLHYELYLWHSLNTAFFVHTHECTRAVKTHIYIHIISEVE